MRVQNENELKEESFLDMLNKQYLESENKEEIDYWFPLTKIIMESIELRDSKQMSQADLAVIMKTRQSVISRFENMGRLPNYDFISRLSIALGHKPGMTLYGDFMAVAPLGMQEFITKMANKEKTTTNKYIQNLLEQSINKERINYIGTRMIYDASNSSNDYFDGNKRQTSMKSTLFLTSDSANNNLAVAI